MNALSTETDELSISDGGHEHGPLEETLRAQLRVQELEEEVVAKDELVTALTVQLEQLAEQLDRLQRSGADKKRSGVGGSLPADVVEGQRKVVGDLERVVQQWEDMQAGLMLGRIEIQLSELRDFIAERLTPGHVPSASVHFPSLPTSVVMERISVSSMPTEPPALETGQAPAREVEPPELPSMWESLKSRMLEETPAITAEDVAGEPIAETEPNPPAPICPSTATLVELEQAIDDRDGYITYLLRRLRQQSAIQPPPDWVSLEQAPEALCQALEVNTKKLDELLRLAEIEMSIERARIGREQAQLRIQQEAIEKQMRRLGLKTIDEQVADQPETTVTDRRWVRFLGLPKGK